MMNFYERVVPNTHKPISAWGYFGYRLLYSIPVIGWIFWLVHAIGAKNRNVRSHARSYLCQFLIALIIIAVVVGVGFALSLTGIIDFTAVTAWIEEFVNTYMTTK
ncbi:MAG: hypothetical protein IJW92_07215 [Clostridia bacterium]|nr:hypothetical protein [Clostridia bacterium]